MGSSVSGLTGRTSIGTASQYQFPNSHVSTLVHASFSDLSKCQTRAALQVHVLAVNQGRQRRQRVAREEVCLGPLQSKFSSVSCISLLHLVFHGV